MAKISRFQKVMFCLVVVFSLICILEIRSYLTNKDFPGLSITTLRIFKITSVCEEVIIPLSIILLMIFQKRKVIPCLLACRCFLYFVSNILFRVNDSLYLTKREFVIVILGVVFIIVLLLYTFNLLTLNAVILVSILILGAWFIVRGVGTYVISNFSLLFGAEGGLFSSRAIDVIYQIADPLLYICSLGMLKEKKG